MLSLICHVAAQQLMKIVHERSDVAFELATGAAD
jgi:hypothetical protein